MNIKKLAAEIRRKEKTSYSTTGDITQFYDKEDVDPLLDMVDSIQSVDWECYRNRNGDTIQGTVFLLPDKPQSLVEIAKVLRDCRDNAPYHACSTNGCCHCRHMNQLVKAVLEREDG